VGWFISTLVFGQGRLVRTWKQEHTRKRLCLTVSQDSGIEFSYKLSYKKEPMCVYTPPHPAHTHRPLRMRSVAAKRDWMGPFIYHSPLLSSGNMSTGGVVESWSNFSRTVLFSSMRSPGAWAPTPLETAREHLSLYRVSRDMSWQWLLRNLVAWPPGF
jgi:hypothetical protein